MDNVFPFLPLCITVGFAIIVMLMEVFMQKNKEGLAYVSLFGIFLAAISNGYLWNNQPNPFRLSFFNEMFVMDNYSLFFNMIFLFCAGVSVFIAPGYLKRENIEHGEFYALILFAVTGMMLMASGGNLITLFLGIEVMSISVYVLVGFKRNDQKSNEATLKYFFLGAFSSGFILYGIALVYGATGSTQLTTMRDVISNLNLSYEKLLIVGILFILIGALFKVAAFPFHVWAPDAYEGAPAPVTGFMITAVKAASFALFLKVFIVSFIDYKDSWQEIISIISILTMFAGNIFAFTQNNIKRMLAYSSISHTGYLLIGMAAISSSIENNVPNAILFYLVAYSVSSLGIFACISYISQKGEEYNNIDDYSGLGFKYPLIGITMSIFMFSLVGVPPTGGFFAKYYLFTAALDQDMYMLVLIGIINSMLSIYYYLRVVAVMYLKDYTRPDVEDTNGRTSTSMVLVYTALVTVWLGLGSFTLFEVFPGSAQLIEWTKVSISSLF